MQYVMGFGPLSPDTMANQDGGEAVRRSNLSLQGKLSWYHVASGWARHEMTCGLLGRKENRQKKKVRTRDNRNSDKKKSQTLSRQPEESSEV